MNQLDRGTRLQRLLERCLPADAAHCGSLNQSAASGVFSQLRPIATLVHDVLPLLRRN